MAKPDETFTNSSLPVSGKVVAVYQETTEANNLEKIIPVIKRCKYNFFP